jgi:hypothetical protein
MTLHYVHAHGKFLHIKVIKSWFFFLGIVSSCIKIHMSCNRRPSITRYMLCNYTCHMKDKNVT